MRARIPCDRPRGRPAERHVEELRVGAAMAAAMPMCREVAVVMHMRARPREQARKKLSARAHARATPALLVQSSCGIGKPSGEEKRLADYSRTASSSFDGHARATESTGARGSEERRGGGGPQVASARVSVSSARSRAWCGPLDAGCRARAALRAPCGCIPHPLPRRARSRCCDKLRSYERCRGAGGLLPGHPSDVAVRRRAAGDEAAVWCGGRRAVTIVQGRFGNVGAN